MRYPNLAQREMDLGYELKKDAEQWLTFVALLVGVAVSLTIIFVHAAA